MKRFEVALTYTGRGGHRPCVMWSLALALDMKGDLVCAVLPAASDEDRKIEPEASDVPFIHAWVEKDGSVYSPTLAFKLKLLTPISISAYYRVNRPTEIKRLSSKEVKALDKRIGFTPALMHRKESAGHRDMTKQILEALGVKYQIERTSSILPLEGEK